MWAVVPPPQSMSIIPLTAPTMESLSDATDFPAPSRSPSVSSAATANETVDTADRPPPEPPPTFPDLMDILDCLPERDHAAFSDQYMRDMKVGLPFQRDHSR